jgi:predicted transposase/invertase (TIGR01784 family)
MSTYINPFTDFGFKKLFGEKSALPRLKSFIEDALELARPIQDLRFMTSEQLGATDDERKAVYDIYCTADDGSHFIVELQRAKQRFFKDRTVFYASFPIRAQAKKGDWNYQLEPVYCLGILDFSFSDTDPMRWHHIVQLKDQEGDVFYSKLTFAFLELGKFNKTIEECTSHLDKWCYMLRNMDEMEQVPEALQNDPLVKSALNEAKLLGMSKMEQMTYEQSLKIYRDLTNVVDTAYDDGAASVQGKLKHAQREKEEAQQREAEAQQREAEAQQREADAQHEKQEAQREKEEAQRQNKILQNTALTALIDSGFPEETARKKLNLPWEKV